MAKKYYVVWEGREPGVYDTWQECERQVKGVAARYKSFPTRVEAERAFGESPWKYMSKTSERKAKADWRQLPPEQQPVLPAIAVDAACSGNPGVMEYQGVEAETGAQLFHLGPLDEGTNNIGEFLAIVHAAALIDQGKLPAWPIYSDSRTGQSWVRQKHAKTKLEETERNAKIFELVDRAEQWLQTHTIKVPVLKWDTDNWGEVPADFGRK